MSVWRVVGLLCLCMAQVIGQIPDVIAIPMDKALLRGVVVGSSDKVSFLLYGAVTQCYQCTKSFIAEVNGTVSNYVEVDSRFPYNFEVRDMDDEPLYSFTAQFGENGKYLLKVITMMNVSISTEIDVDQEPINSFMPIYVGIGVCVGVAAIWVFLTYAYRKLIKNRGVASGDGSINYEEVNDNEKKEKPVHKVKSKARLRSLDTFRGIALCIMIFVNYGGGGYWFFDHSFWDGLTVADLVFPWFIFIMGVAIPLALGGMLKRKVSKASIFLKILKRSIILYGLGLFLNNGYDISHWRIPGVLQRFGWSYFVVASMFTFIPNLFSKTSAQSGRKASQEELNNPLLSPRSSHPSTIASMFADIYPYLLHWVVAIIILVVWLCVTFFLPVPGCPTGYLGPGGLAEYSKYENCTGGAAGYIDKLVFGENHIYTQPTCQPIYGCGSYDPEGLLGYLTSALMCFLGLQTGRILQHFQDHRDRVPRFLIWGVLWGGLGAILCFGSQFGGPLPVNKNLWTPTFIFVLAGMANILFAFCYVVCDIINLWSGAPFTYLGMNSILMYCGHDVLSSFFPFHWAAKNTHLELLAQHMTGASLWLLISYYCYKINFFINI